ncbi:glycosyltransferase family 87 protein [Anaerolineales bacterium HSG25]|nr:glycosyltransferase family 87 protein [Anaerolineales bacterium HSG25]
MKNKRTVQIVFVSLLVSTLLMTYPSYRLLVEPRGQGFDWFPVWVGSRAILGGVDPYGPETTATIHYGVYKNFPQPDEYQHGFSHPPYIAFILLPFVSLPYSWSVLLWVSLQIPLFMMMLLLGLRLLRWLPRPWELFGLILLSLIGFRFPIIVYVLGQLTFWVMACLLLSIWLYQQGQIRWAALAFAGATIRPDLAILATLPMLMLVWREPHRNRFLVMLMGVGAVLALLPVPFLGFWPTIWVESILAYGSNNPNATWPPSLLGNVWLGAGMLIMLALWLVYYSRLAWQIPSPRHQQLFISATILTGLIALKQTGSYNLTLVLIPSIILMRQTPNQAMRGLIALSLLSPWLYFSLGESFERLIFLLIPAQFIVWQEIVYRGWFRSRPSNHSNRYN